MSTRSGRVRQSLIEPSPRSRKGVSPSRSPARSRKSSPTTRSTTRKSPSRKSPIRKSPSRKTKNTASKSPSRPLKETETVKVSTPSKRQALRSNAEVKLTDIADKFDTYRTRRSRLIEYSIGDLQSNVSKTELTVADQKNGLESRFTSLSDYNFRIRKPLEVVPPRVSTRLQEFAMNTDIRRSISKSISERSKSISKSISKSLGTVSDEENSEDDLPRRKSTSVTRRLATPLRASVAKIFPTNKKFEFGGNVGPLLLIILIPLTVFFILTSCSKLCSHTLLDLSEFKSINIWYNNESLILIVAQYLIQALLVVLPVFGQRDNEKGKKHCFNAFFSCILTTTVLFSLNYFKKVNFNSITSSYLSLAATSYVTSVLLAIYLYIKSRKLDTALLNPYGNTGYFINDFLVGREIHSFIKNLNIKLWITRVCNINTLVLSMLIFKCGFQLPTKEIDTLSLDNYKEFMSKVHFKPTIVLYSMMQIVYILNYVLKEHKITSTFYWQSEGLGYLQTTCSALYPFYFTSISKYVLDVELEMSTNALVAALTLFLLGFLIMLISNNIKHEFRKNPFHPSVTRLDSMPTFQGNKLLISNLWGILRHPNYTGDILIHIAFALPGILTKRPVVALPAVLTVFVLLHRARRDHNRCLERYGSAWQRYCKRVPSVLIPKIL